MNSAVKAKIKDWMLPIAMICGVIFHQWIGYLTFLSPYLIFLMLLVTYCKMEPRDLKFGHFQLVLLVAQLALAFIFYFLLVPVGHNIACGVFICVFVPTATAAPVITGMLGGSITKVATYSLLCNLVAAFTGPLILAAIGDHPEMTFLESFTKICKSVMPLLLMPMLTAFFLRAVWRKGHDFMATNQSLSFYMWAVALLIVVGSSISKIILICKESAEPSLFWEIAGLLVFSLITCLSQFAIGKRIGHHYGDTISGGQSLGQKNTVLAIWLALAYLNPIASIAPAAYVAWHNIVNSYQIIQYHRHHPQSL
jgi:BASS family bile acid:Na+ symporter